jgi:nucleoside-triphosphatase
MASFIVLCDKIKSGKSTALMLFAQKMQNTAGIICPDENGLRIVYNTYDKTKHVFQLPQVFSDDDVQIGKYIFAEDGFAFARESITAALYSDAEYIIIDEVGKLELDGSGLEPAFSKFMKVAKTLKGKTIILVIRDTLLGMCMVHFKLPPIWVYDVEEFIEVHKLK